MMKKSKNFWLVCLCMILAAAGSAQVPVTFQVDMNNETVSADGVHIAGGFQGWDPAATLLTDDDSDGVYELTIDLPAGSTYEFKFINGASWDLVEDVPPTCQVEVSGNDNRFVTVGAADTEVTYPVCWESCAACGLTTVRFRVDMINEGTISPNGVHVAGNFQGWDPSSSPLSDADGDGVWETWASFDPLDIMDGALVFKFINGDDWFNPEALTGEACSDDFGNRVLNFEAENMVLIGGSATNAAPCFNACGPCVSPTNTVVDIIVNSEDHTLFEVAVGAAGLVDALSGEGPFTVFAPTDDAFTTLTEALGITVAELLALPIWGDILQYHVVGAEAYSTDLSNGQEIETLLGENVTVSITADGVFINNAQVIVADLIADNGVVHVIDAVLLPVLEEETTVVDIIVNSEDHTLFEVAVGAAGLVDALSGEGPFTVFAPTDDAFTTLTEALGITVEDLLAIPNLAEILLYHVVGAEVYSADFSDGQEIEMLFGGDITVSITTDGGVFINDAQVIVADITADNGVLHVIDAVILPTAGCTDVEAINFDSDANFDDGTCVYITYDCFSIGNEAWSEEGFGVFPDWQEAIHGLAWEGEWVLNIPETIVEPGSGVVYGVHHMDWTGLEGLPDWVETASYDLGELDASSQHCIAVSGAPAEPGLLEITATGEVFISIFGQPFSIGEQSFSAWLEVAENPNPIPGCTYSNAVNFVSFANDDDGSCLFSGCTDATAGNFNPIATIDDGSCGEGCDPTGDSTCQADNDGDGVITVTDLLILLSEFGAECE